MPTMGLRLNQSGRPLVDASLGDTLAKALFGDTDTEIKLARLRDDMAMSEYERRQRQAATDYNAALTQAAQEKAVREQAVHDADARAGKVLGKIIYDNQGNPVAVAEEPVPVDAEPAPAFKNALIGSTVAAAPMIDTAQTTATDAPAVVEQPPLNTGKGDRVVPQEPDPARFAPDMPVSIGLPEPELDPARFGPPASSMPLVSPPFTPADAPLPVGEVLSPAEALRVANAAVSDDGALSPQEAMRVANAAPASSVGQRPTTVSASGGALSPEQAMRQANAAVAAVQATDAAAAPGQRPAATAQADPIITSSTAPVVSPPPPSPTATGDWKSHMLPNVPTGKTVDNGDGTVTHGGVNGPVRLTQDQADALGLSIAFKTDAAGQAMKAAGLTALTYDPEVRKELTPAQRAATIASGGTAPSRESVLGTDEAIRFERSKNPEKAAADAAKAEQEALAAAQKGEQDLRKEYASRDETNRYLVIRDRYREMKSALERGGGFGDTTAIYAYIKMLDPTSSVMEGEQATARNAPGIAETTRAYLNSLLTDARGGKYTDDARKQLLDEGRSIYNGTAAKQREINAIFERSARAYKIDPTRVLVPVEDDPAAAPAAPQASPPASTGTSTAPATPATASNAPAAPAAPADEPAPAGVDPELWKRMTPEEKALFK